MQLDGWIGAGVWLVATQKCLMFNPKIGEDEPILTIIFFIWVAQPPTSSVVDVFSCILVAIHPRHFQLELH